MIKCEVVFDGSVLKLNGYNIRQCIYDDLSESWDVRTDMFGYECCFNTLEQAIKYCMEQSK